MTAFLWLGAVWGGLALIAWSFIRKDRPKKTTALERARARRESQRNSGHRSHAPTPQQAFSSPFFDDRATTLAAMGWPQGRRRNK